MLGQVACGGGTVVREPSHSPPSSNHAAGYDLAVPPGNCGGRLLPDAPEAATATGFESARSAKMAAYALCGFANSGSIGIQIGGLGPLAPERKPLIAKLALRAMLGGAFASWMTATVAGMFLA